LQESLSKFLLRKNLSLARISLVDSLESYLILKIIEFWGAQRFESVNFAFEQFEVNVIQTGDFISKVFIVAN